MGELLPEASLSGKGLMSAKLYSMNVGFNVDTKADKFTHLFTLSLYEHICFYLKFGNVTSNYLSNSSIIDLQNRSANKVNVVVGKTTILSNQLEANLYARRNSNSSIDVFVKQIVVDYPVIKLSCLFANSLWKYVGKVSDVIESELTKII